MTTTKTTFHTPLPTSREQKISRIDLDGAGERVKTTVADLKGKPKRDEGTIDEGFENDLQRARKRSMDVDTSHAS